MIALRIESPEWGVRSPRWLAAAEQDSADILEIRPARPTSPVPFATNESRARATAEGPSCPTCGGRMWDNRFSKRNPNAPDFRCRRRDCDGRIWPALEQVSYEEACTREHARRRAQGRAAR